MRYHVRVHSEVATFIREMPEPLAVALLCCIDSLSRNPRPDWSVPVPLPLESRVIDRDGVRLRYDVSDDEREVRVWHIAAALQ